MFSGGYSKEAKEKPLRDYQTYAVKWQMQRLFVQREKGVGLFLDPGLGKTRTTLTLLDALFDLGEVGRVLIVAPLRPVYTVWPAEIQRWGFPQSHIILHNQYVKALSYNCKIELVNYDGLERLREIKNRWDMIVLDESTFIKNWSTDRTKNLREMLKTIPRRSILTGTPASNSLSDLHSQMFVVDDGEALGKNVTAFRNRFCYQGGWQGRKWSVKDHVRDEIKNAIQDKVLRLQAEDFLDMPELVQNEIWVNMGEKAVKEYRRLKKELFAELETGNVFAATAASAYTKCRQFANGQVYTPNEDGTKTTHIAHKRKVEALYELFEELAGKPLLVFYSYKHDLQQIQGAKNSPFRGCPVVSGGMKVADLMKILDEWNAGKHKGILAQWQAASHGLNMQGCCNDVACFGLVDSLEIYDQAIRRVYRQGVTGKQVRIHRLLTKGTVDEVMLDRLNGKHESQSAFLTALKKHAKG